MQHCSTINHALLVSSPRRVFTTIAEKALHVDGLPAGTPIPDTLADQLASLSLQEQDRRERARERGPAKDGKTQNEKTKKEMGQPPALAKLQAQPHHNDVLWDPWARWHGLAWPGLRLAFKGLTRSASTQALWICHPSKTSDQVQAGVENTGKCETMDEMDAENGASE